MADTVRNLMEQMLPELEELEERGYFTRNEIKQILRRRAYFEYLMKRKAALKADMLRYLQYESRLQELLQLRKVKLGSDSKEGYAEGSVLRRMHFIFERATRRFKGDLSLWLGWLQLCKDARSSKSLSKVATRALQLHPAEPGLWAAVAAWEWEVNSDAASARALMQRGLRACPKSASLWVDYFRLELLFAAKLHARRRVLGLAGEADAGSPSAEPSPADADKGAAAMTQLLQGGLAARVFTDAVAALPSSLPLRMGCLKALSDVGLAGSQGLGSSIWQGIATDFADSVDAWDMRAQHALAETDAGGSDAAMGAEQVYEQATVALPTAAMYERYCSFAQQQMQDAADVSKRSGGLQGPAKQWAQKLLAVHQRAIAAGCASEAILLQHQQLLLRLGQARAAADAAEAACSAEPKSLALWQQCLLLQSQLDQDKPALRLLDLTSRAAEAVGLESAADAWRSGIAMLTQTDGRPSLDSPQQHPLQAMAQRFADSMLGKRQGPPEGGLGEVAGELVLAIQQSSGMEQARAAYQQFWAGPSPGGDFHLAVLRLELQQQPPERLNDAQLQSLFEVAVSQYGQEHTQLWLLYCRYEVQHRQQGLGKLYWRATRTLAEPEAFIQAAQALR